jgi:hypothetical protein
MKVAFLDGAIHQTDIHRLVFMAGVGGWKSKNWGMGLPLKIATQTLQSST